MENEFDAQIKELEKKIEQLKHEKLIEEIIDKRTLQNFENNILKDVAVLDYDSPLGKTFVIRFILNGKEIIIQHKTESMFLDRNIIAENIAKEIHKEIIKQLQK